MKIISVYGQSKVKEILQSAFQNNKLAHAYLFVGPEGSGKQAAAVAVALMVNCENKEFGGCGECRSCISILNHEAADFTFVQPVPKKAKSMKEEVYRDIVRERLLRKLSNPYRKVKFTPELTTTPIISVDQIRALKKNAILKVASQEMRIFIISHADKMNANASNGLLKLLEEPPPNTILILTSSEEGALLETVVSRCQIIRFAPLTDQEVCDALEKEDGLNNSEARLISAMAEGSITQGLDLAGSEFNVMKIEAVDFLHLCMEGRFEHIGSTAVTQSMLKEREYTRDIIRFLIVWLRDLMFMKLDLSERVINIDRVEGLNETLIKFPDFKIENAMDHLYQAIDYIGKNVYLPLIVFSLSSHIYFCAEQKG